MKNKYIWLGLVVILLPFFNIEVAEAATFVVDTVVDTVDVNIGNGSCADASGNCSLRAAIQEANGLAGADIITLPVGTYTLSIAGTGEDASTTGDLDIISDITINGLGSGSTIIDANSIDNVFHINPSAGSSTVILNDITIANGSNGIMIVGDGITTMNRVVIKGAITNGVNNNASSGILEINDSIFKENFIGLFNLDLVYVDSSTFTENTSQGVRNTTGGTLNIENSTISGNSAHGMTVTAGVANVTNCTISFNQTNLSETGTGGVVNIRNTIISNASLTNCINPMNSLGNNIEDTNTWCGFTDTSDLEDTDPFLMPLADYGGYTLTHELQPCSPAINAGTDTGAPSDDQRGETRVGVTDIGAYERLDNGADCEQQVTVTASVPSALTFAVAGVSTGNACVNSGGNASVTSTGSTIPFGIYSGAQTKIACQTLTVSTNATNGYVVTVEQDQLLTSSSADTMKAFSGSYATPTTWASPPGSGTESYFGFTTDDTGYSNFQTSKYGSFGANDTPYNIMTGTDPVIDEVNVVSYQLEVTDLQEAGTYSNTVMYIATATF